MPSAKDKRDKRKQALAARRTQEETVFAKASVHDANEEETGDNVVLEAAKDEVGRIVEEKGLKEAEYHSGAAIQLAKEKEEALVREQAQELRQRLEEQAMVNKRRKRNRLSVDELYQQVDSRQMPFVEFHDARAPDPVFCVKMKGVRNSIPVPPHWINKRMFLSQQTDREHGDYVVPDFIKGTGVHEVRADPVLANKGFRSLLKKAFFFPDPRDSNKPPMTKFGEAFYEGKDLTAIRNNFIPGKISERLQNALGMSENHPPPWLMGMQTVQALPPSYPNMKLPGLNAPIPPTAAWGKAVGQWGEPARRRGDEGLVFPAVLGRWKPEDVDGMSNSAKYWGTIRPETQVGNDDDEPAAPAPQAPQPVMAQPIVVPAMPAHFAMAAGMAPIPGMGGLPPGAPGMYLQQQPGGVAEYARQNVGINAQGIMAQNVVLQRQQHPPPPR